MKNSAGPVLICSLSTAVHKNEIKIYDKVMIKNVMACSMLILIHSAALQDVRDVRKAFKVFC